MSKLPRGAGVGMRREKYFSPSSSPTQQTLTRAPLGSLDTLPRLRSPLQTDGSSSTEAYESRKSHGKIGDCEQSMLPIIITIYFREQMAVTNKQNASSIYEIHRSSATGLKQRAQSCVLSNYLGMTRTLSYQYSNRGC